MSEVTSLDEQKIEQRAAAYERNDNYAVDVAPHLGASRLLMGEILRTHGSLDKQTGRFSTGMLLQGDFAADRIGTAWVTNGFEISTIVQDWERPHFSPEHLGRPKDMFSLRLSAWQVANRAAGMQRDDGWREETYKAGRQSITAFIRPAPVFSHDMDDHVWVLSHGLESRARRNHTLPLIDMPETLSVQAEVEAVRSNYETLARMVGELSMPLTAVTQDKLIHAYWQ